ncbi:YceI family protein [Sinomonas mesophila]|uniref:YceI family protein n=1 Tax=Sinomonas mesophila TaxID=1531955 RepID=UPI000986A5D2|nr:YceI family protein [Sinomonas mesophila]
MTIIHGLTTGTWTLDPSHSDIAFTVRHAGISKVRGRFTDAAGSVEAGHGADGTQATAVIKTASFDSGDGNRDAHVKGADFFDVERFPEITFTSTSIEAKGDDFDVTGDLTIKGVTRQVTIETEFNGTALDPFGNTRAGLSGETTISRKDFGLTWNAVLETGGVLVSDKVVISLDLAFIAPQS